MAQQSLKSAAPNGAVFMSRMLREISVDFQRATIDAGESVQHERNMVRPLPRPIRVRSTNAPPSNAPRPQREEMALKYARHWLAGSRDLMTEQAGISAWRFWRKLSAVGTISHSERGPEIGEATGWISHNVRELVDLAERGDGDARNVLIEMIAELFARGEQVSLPELLRHRMAGLLGGRNPIKRKRFNAHANTSRDHQIASLIERICRRFDLTPLRCVATRHLQSACSIVAKAAREEGIANSRGRPITEGAVEKIWKAAVRRKRRA
jgi:hypothetical protein